MVEFYGWGQLQETADTIIFTPAFGSTFDVIYYTVQDTFCLQGQG